MTPGGSSRPGSALSTSTTTSGVVYRRTSTARKPRPASIAGTGMTQESKLKLPAWKTETDGLISFPVSEALKQQQRKEHKPPIPRPQSAIRKSTSTSNTNISNSTSTAAKPAPTQETPKRNDKRLSARKVSDGNKDLVRSGKNHLGYLFLDIHSNHATSAAVTR